MRESWKHRAVLGTGLVALLVGLWLWFRPAAEKIAKASEIAPKTASGNRHDNEGNLSAAPTNTVKRALRNSSWQIVARGGRAPSAAVSNASRDGGQAEAGEAAGGSPPSVARTDLPPEVNAKLSLEFVRANFDAAGMRGVSKFAAFSPPQFAAIKGALEKRRDTEVSAAPDEFAPDGETVGFDLVNAEDGREFSLDFTPAVGANGETIRMRTVTRGPSRRRDAILPIWDGQTLMIPLGESNGSEQTLAAFVTVRLTSADGKPIHDIVVNP